MTATVLPFPTIRRRQPASRVAPRPSVASTRPVDLAAYRRRRSKSKRRRDDDADADDDRWAPRAHAVIDTAETLLASGRAADVVTFCEQAITCLRSSAAEVRQSPEMAELSARIDTLHRRARREMRAHPAGLARRQMSLFSPGRR